MAAIRAILTVWGCAWGVCIELRAQLAGAERLQASMFKF